MISRTRVVTVSYNTPGLIEKMVRSLRTHYPSIPCTVIDGSEPALYDVLKYRTKDMDFDLVHFGHNIHHGPGLAWAIETLKEKFLMVLDSDIEVINGRFIEDLFNHMQPGMYGVGDIQTVNAIGVNVDKGIRYLHPACMLIDREVAASMPLPIKHGAPMIDTMKHIHDTKQHDLIGHVDWVRNDFREPGKIYIRHDWQGTVKRTGGYHL